MQAQELSAASAAPQVRPEGIAFTQPLRWLRMGWDDLMYHQKASFAHGALVTATGAIILLFGNHPYFIAAAISGFLLVGPILAAGLCELSRRRARNEKLNFDLALEALQRNREGLLRFGGVLLLIGVGWLAVSTVILHWALGGTSPEVGSSLWASITNQASAMQAFAYVASGGLLAALVFALSVVSVPMLIDRPTTTASEAMQRSIHLVLRYLPVMLLWAALIGALTVLGFATLLLGFLVIFPLLGHATWHAYEDLVGVHVENAPRTAAARAQYLREQGRLPNE